MYIWGHGQNPIWWTRAYRDHSSILYSHMPLGHATTWSLWCIVGLQYTSTLSKQYHQALDRRVPTHTGSIDTLPGYTVDRLEMEVGDWLHIVKNGTWYSVGVTQSRSQLQTWNHYGFRTLGNRGCLVIPEYHKAEQCSQTLENYVVRGWEFR